MTRRYTSGFLLFFAMAVCVLGAALEVAQVSRKTPFILKPDEGDAVGSHYIKADPGSGSSRFGAGMQHLKAGAGIPVHLHEKEDELLFVHSGSGVGSVGGERKSIGPGTTLYIPQNTWHGIESDSQEMQILWVVSPPHFAENLRELAAKPEGGQNRQDIGKRHGFRDGQDFFLPRIARIAAVLGLAAVLVSLLSGAHPFRATAIYFLGATLATLLTLFAVGPGELPVILFIMATLIVSVTVAIGAIGGVCLRRLTRRARPRVAAS